MCLSWWTKSAVKIQMYHFENSISQNKVHVCESHVFIWFESNLLCLIFIVHLQMLTEAYSDFSVSVVSLFLQLDQYKTPLSKFRRHHLSRFETIRSQFRFNNTHEKQESRWQKRKKGEIFRIWGQRLLCFCSFLTS